MLSDLAAAAKAGVGLALLSIVALVHNRKPVAPPFRSRISNDLDGDWHAEPCDPIEHVASGLRFGPLIGQSPGMKMPTKTVLYRWPAFAWRIAGPLVNETHTAAVSVAYGALPENADDDLAGAYAETARSVVDLQLLKAGLRLAALLKAALK